MQTRDGIMTPEQRRIALAEVCGWTFNPPPYNKPPFSAEFKAEALLCWIRPGNMSHQLEAPPDYLNDLNAMRKALLTLNDAQAIKYRCILTQMGVDHNFDPFMAEAKWQAKALLHTLNLWIE